MTELRIDREFQALIPSLTEDECARLEASILEDGCRDPLVTWDGVIVDGHNRYAICQRYGLAYQTVERQFADRQAARAWIISNQLARRNLTPEQRNYLIGKQYMERKLSFAEAGALKGKSLDQNELGFSTAGAIAVEHKVGEATVKRAAQFAQAVDAIAENVGQEAREKILSREAPMTAKEVHRVAAMEPDRQKPIIDMVLSGHAKNVMDAHRLLRQEAAREAPPLEGKYRVIYADPPWKYGNTMPDYFAEQADHYPLMTVQEICGMPVRDLAEENAVLFLWATSPILEESFRVINAWGFNYKASFIWDKIRHNMGHYNSVRHELLLIATRGSCQPDVNRLFDSVQSIERSRHSEKPEEFRQIIDTLYPAGKRIELFARRRAEGWDSYGNEIS
mgnify:FL=1